MALYVYRKRKPKIVSQKTKKLVVLPSVFFIMGLSILGYVAFPYLSYYLAQTFKVDIFNKELISPQDGFKVLAATDENNSAGDYNKNIAANIAGVNKEIQENKNNYQDISAETGKMYLTIDKIGLKKVPININTDSGAESEYNPILKSAVAHFKGTSLPGHKGNTFVYGHSARVLTNAAQSYESIFTDLEKMDIGDEFYIEYNGKTFNYMVTRIHIVNKENLSVLQGDSNKKTLSLMTCTPPGLALQRLIVDAVQQ